MRARPLILKKLALDVWRTGKSITATARICAVPVGTVKTWRSRGKWKRHEPRHETPAPVVKRAGHETTHRGLSWQHMPSNRDANKKMVFAMFRLKQWPPRKWQVPGHLEGGELMMMLHERACMNERKPKA